MNSDDPLREIAVKLGIGSYQRHVLLCTGPNCCDPDEGMKAWEALKREIKSRGLGDGPRACYRTKVGCLRVCAAGPAMVVYPEGTWYHGMNADRIPEFVARHLVDGKPIEDSIFAVNPLPDPPVL